MRFCKAVKTLTFFTDKTFIIKVISLLRKVLVFCLRRTSGGLSISSKQKLRELEERALLTVVSLTTFHQSIAILVFASKSDKFFASAFKLHIKSYWRGVNE